MITRTSERVGGDHPQSVHSALGEGEGEMSDQLTQEAYELRRVYEADMQVNSCEVDRLIAEVRRATRVYNQCEAEIDKQMARALKAELEVERLRFLVKGIEWIRYPIEPFVRRRCPCCGNGHPDDGGDGHDADCRLRAALEGKP